MFLFPPARPDGLETAALLTCCVLQALLIPRRVKAASSTAGMADDARRFVEFIDLVANVPIMLFFYDACEQPSNVDRFRLTLVHVYNETWEQINLDRVLRCELPLSVLT